MRLSLMSDGRDLFSSPAKFYTLLLKTILNETIIALDLDNSLVRKNWLLVINGYS